MTAGDKVNFDAAAVDGFDSFDLVQRNMTTYLYMKQDGNIKNARRAKKETKPKAQNSLPSVSSAIA